MKNDIIYFELNNWMAGTDHPDAQPFYSWMNDYNLRTFFGSERWTKQNELCVVWSNIDMSANFCISAKREWVEKCCPELLTKYTQFIRYPEDEELPEGRFGCRFVEYSADNFGVWASDYDYDNDYYKKPYCINKCDKKENPWGIMHTNE